ncbi:MAG TPA: DUF2971 domain-containing protein [Candidatus Blautia stercoravium]|nr:DUF2971 domain-containing protein [Candidatus Blautia stercoravium]
MKKFVSEVFARNIQEWIPIPRCRQGEKIFHYTDLRALKGMVTEQSFWVTKSDFLNDKYEFRYAYKVIRKVCEKMIPGEENRHLVISGLKHQLEMIDNVMENRVLSGWYVLSFSRQRDSLLLWTEFGKSQGYCLEFEYSSLADSLESGIMLDGYVIYEKEQQKKLIEATINHLLGEKGRSSLKEKLLSEGKKVTEEELYPFLMEFAVCSFVYSMFFKKECFREEKEYRFVFWAFHEEEEGSGMALTPMHFREKNQTLIPYIEVRYQQEGESPICAITVGPKNNSDLAVRGIQYFLRNEKIDIPVYESKIPLRY